MIHRRRPNSNAPADLLVHPHPDIHALLDDPMLAALTDLAIEASRAILAVRRDALAVRAKPDQSPVTAADEAAEAVLLAGLARLMPDIPVVSEEQAAHAPRLESGTPFILVDPLDGTREFVAGRDEFTVNIGVVMRGAPVAGVIAAPARGLLWRGVVGRGAERLACSGGSAGSPVPVRTRAWPSTRATALVSRSHADAATDGLLARMGVGTREACGSALKFCLLAQGGADIYPRLAPTSEWDIAAGHAIVVAAGGAMARPDGAALVYGAAAPSFLVPGFIACGDPAAMPRAG